MAEQEAELAGLISRLSEPLAGDWRLIARKYPVVDTNLPRRDLRAVVLTGGSGFLGSHILAQLLHRRRLSKIYCVARLDDDNPTLLRERILSSLRFYNLTYAASLIEAGNA